LLTVSEAGKGAGMPMAELAANARSNVEAVEYGEHRLTWDVAHKLAPCIPHRRPARAS
jgi:hypothetical protein